MIVSEIATSDVVTAAPDTQVRDIVAAMAEENVGSVVVDEDRPVGIVTDRGIALATLEHDGLSGVTADELQVEGRELVTVGSDASVSEALETMEKEAIRRIPIVDDGVALSGIVTLDDIVVALAASTDHVAGVIEGQTRS